MGKSVTLLIILLIAIIGLSIYTIIGDLPGPTTPLQTSYNSNTTKQEVLSSEIKTIEDNIRFADPNISYTFEDNCPQDERTKMVNAFSELQGNTPLSFYESPTGQIDIACSNEEIKTGKNTMVAGEGAPEYLNATIYPLVIKGKITLYKSECKEPVVELHELLHVLGFDHVNDPNSIMFPYSSCTQKLSQSYFNYLTQLYSIPAKPELFFEDTNITKSGRYLDFKLSITNNGIKDTHNVTLNVYSDNKSVKDIEIGDINIGVTKILGIQNLKLPSSSSSEIKLVISDPLPEYNEENNVLIAKV